jgi:hypothetical protein
MPDRRDEWAALARRHHADAHRLRREHHIPDDQPLTLDPWLHMTPAQRAADEAFFAECFRWRPTRGAR